MKSKIKIIFVDIDWTILDHNKHDWDYESLDGLKKAQDNGVLVYLCTARPYDSILHTGIFEHFNPDGIIATNGGVAFVGDEVLYSNEIPREIVDEVKNVANNRDLVVEMSTDRGRYFTAPKNKWVDEYFKSYAETIPPTITDQNGNVSAMLLFAPEFMDETLMAELPDEIRYFRFDLYGVDLCYYQNNKGIAINRVLEHLNIEKEEALGAGDDYGDIPMFEAVGISVAVANGKDGVKEKATYIADSVGDHGIARILEKLGII